MAPSFVLAASDLVDRWRDIGPVLWVAAGATFVVWIATLAVLAARSEPRDVAPGPATLDPGGPEPPAIVNLVTNDWELGREAVPATLLDLAARRFVSVDWIGERTLLRVREHGPQASSLADYERLVLDHVRDLSRQTEDGFVPADALTTGPEAMAKGWWRRFERGVIGDARARGLSQSRWSANARTILTTIAIVVGVAVAIASTTLPTDKDDDDDDPIGRAFGFGGVSAVVLIAVVSKLDGERDTPDGRVVASRWLGLRTMLANDPTFATQPPAAVNIWERIMSNGAALGVARTAVAALPFGSESERQAWSPVGNRWRVVRIRYPRRIPPGYGRHPALVALVGLIATAVGIAIAPGAVSLADAILRSIDDLATDHTVPAGVRAAVGVALALVVTIGALIAAFGAALLVAGVGDLVRRRRTIEGRVLRIRERGDDEHRFWHVAVDDGTADRVRAWRMKSAPHAHQGATVRARVSPWLRHVIDLAVIRSDDLTSVAAPSAPAAALAAGGASAPPLPDASAVSAALGWPVSAAPDAVPHPLAVDGASRPFVTPDGGRLIAAWIRPSELEAHRHMPASLATPVSGIGEESYRSPMGGGLVARVGGNVLMVVGTLPSLDDAQRDRVIAAMAQLMLANAVSR
jgi:hypothetical protein